MSGFFARADRVFLVLGLIFGLLYLFVTPPFRGPDEAAHFQRAFELAHGVVEGRTPIPRSLDGFKEDITARNGRLYRGDDAARYGAQDVRGWIDTPLARENAPLINIKSSSSAYTPLPYLGVMPMQRLALAFELPPVGVLWAARLGGMLVGVFGVWVVLRACPPRLAWPLALMALMPVTVFIRSMVSADTLTLAIAWGYAVLVLHLARGQGRMAGREIAALGVLATALCLSKNAYALLPLAALAIPAPRWGGWRRQVALVGAVMLPGLALSAGWALWVKATYYAMHGPEPIRGSWPEGQLTYMWRHPALYALALFKTVFSWHFLWHVGVVEFAGSLCYQDRYPPLWATVAYWPLALLLLWRAVPGEALSSRQRLWLAAAAISGIVLGLTFLYVQWTAYKAPLIGGFQGRYLHPILPLLLLALMPAAGKVALSDKAAGCVVTAVTVIANLAGLWAIVQGDYR
ncbi:MAG: DUF2142 domain-containing protein [Alphaproteobacteria bacterium]|nr:DUF2142 domain-containing protein [Alphaproteobacteria bacterium]